MVTANDAMDTNLGKHTGMPGKDDTGSYANGIEDGTGITTTGGDGNRKYSGAGQHTIRFLYTDPLP
jgi:hypothetical protein